ncbi:ribose 5-phosphate isomerase B [Campylobacter sp. FMV-PI01]|uniref:Ribose 5-phosphate isomerase B n=1 Tax=Campylobacter portucalensis TaxID=2608384 RepID=A0A6L5WL52_9BACT|nr:ribose 5-phosphate isomerase B [Campylobacter portucalensis]MSN96735.1 ribose 5-phosphate isomerase B [Campylobacter portucalensis]
MIVEKIYIASDHAGVDIKKTCKEFLESLNFEVIDLGTDSLNSVDYPDFAYKLTNEVKKNSKFYGVLICGTGIGISIAANRDKNIRCALCHNENTATLAREHNDANVLAFGARVVDENLAKKMCEVFFNTEFAGNRHKNRVLKLSKES